LDLKKLATPTPYKSLLVKTPKDWKRAESRLALGFNGLSNCRKCKIAQQNQENEAKDRVKCER